MSGRTCPRCFWVGHEERGRSTVKGMKVQRGGALPYHGVDLCFLSLVLRKEGEGKGRGCYKYQAQTVVAALGGVLAQGLGI